MNLISSTYYVNPVINLDKVLHIDIPAFSDDEMYLIEFKLEDKDDLIKWLFSDEKERDDAFEGIKKLGTYV